MDIIQFACKENVGISVKPETTSVSPPHRIFMTEDVMESILEYLDTPSLKQCRLVCSSWIPLTTHFLMSRTFFALPSFSHYSLDRFYAKKTITSVKIKGAQLSQLSSKILSPSSFPNHWKSIFVSIVPSSSEISSVTSFLSSTQLPQLTHLKINFATVDPRQTQFQCDPQMLPANLPLGVLQRMREELLQIFPPLNNLLMNQAPPQTNVTLNVDPISNQIQIHSLHLSLEDETDISLVSAFLRVLLQKKTLPNLDELVVEFKDSPLQSKPGDYPSLKGRYKKILKTLEERGEILGSLRVLRIKLNVPMGMYSPGSAIARYVMRSLIIPELPAAGVHFKLSKEIKHLQLGSGLVAPLAEGTVGLPEFLPNVLTPSVASVLETLDLSGFFISPAGWNHFAVANFPQLPCLRKLTAEELAVLWIKNFPTIFQKAPSIREFRVKNSFPHWKVSRFLRLEELIDFNKWEVSWGLGEYPSLRLLELGDSVDVKSYLSFRKMSRVFPNVEVLQFTCDDESRRLQRTNPIYLCEVDFMILPAVVGGLKEWKSLKHLSLTYWPHYSVNEMLNHFIMCADSLPNLCLYDFRRSDIANPSMRAEELRSASYLDELKQKCLQLKASPQLVFVLQNFSCPHQHRADGAFKRLRKCFVMEELFLFAEKNDIFNFRKGVK